MLGATEIALILVVALVIFGPRKLPELGKSFGQAMAQFRRASEDFKRTWEQEVEGEKIRKGDGGAAGDSAHAYESEPAYNPYAEEPAPADATAQPPAASPATPAAESPAATTAPKHWI
jgi:sec-independent protein translocase protein TatA